jgi:pilus assembly protein Flp/PilA
MSRRISSAHLATTMEATMNDWKYALGRLAEDESGVTSIEYALIGSLIATVCVVTLVSVGGNLNSLYTNVCKQVSTAVSGAPAC